MAKQPIKYDFAKDGELIPVTTNPRRKTRIACCDCALVHQHRVVIRVDKRGHERVYIRYWRDDKETARLRKKNRIRFREK